MKNAAVLIFILVGFSLRCFAQELKTTDALLESLLTEAATELMRQAGQMDTVSLVVSPHPDAPYVESVLLTTLQRHRAVIVNSGAPYQLQVIVADMSTRYTALVADSVQRIVSVSLNARVVHNEKVHVYNVPKQVHTDAGTRRNMLLAESDQHAASRGNMPPMQTTFWDDILEPAIFVAAAATTVVLLFTVRSK